MTGHVSRGGLCVKPGCGRTLLDAVHSPMSACPFLGRDTRNERPSGDPTKCPWPKEHHDPVTGKAFE